MLIGPDIVDPCVFRDGVFGDDFWPDLVGPVDLEDGVVMGKDKDALIVHVI